MFRVWISPWAYHSSEGPPGPQDQWQYSVSNKGINRGAMGDSGPNPNLSSTVLAVPMRHVLNLAFVLH